MNANVFLNDHHALLFSNVHGEKRLMRMSLQAQKLRYSYSMSLFISLLLLSTCEINLKPQRRLLDFEPEYICHKYD